MTRPVPILVGIAQLEQRSEDPLSAQEPITLMHEALTQAAADAGAVELLQRASSLRVIKGFWPYRNPGRFLAQQLGCDAAESVLTPYGGNFVQTVVNQSALDIQSGRQDIILMTGAECGYSQARARKRGLAYGDLGWQKIEGTPDRLIGEEKPMSHPAELAAGIRMPIQYYPMFENALRFAEAESISTHQSKIAGLWSRFSQIASENPHAWIREHYNATTIATPSPDNRPVSFPYPKLMNSNNNVDQAAALILCSETTATELGIPEEKWVFPHAGTDAEDHYFVSHRDNLYTSPAIRLAGNRCLELAATEAGMLDYVDLYSCFPVAVEVAARELNLDLNRPLSVTGGLTFGGGPLNNYVMHSIARMAELLRQDTDAKGLVTGNGGYLTKHAFGLYSAQRPQLPFQHQNLQPVVDTTPRREVAMDYTGSIEVEAYTVMYGPEAPEQAFLACRLPDGRRAWGHLQEASVLKEMLSEEACGRRGWLTEERVSLND